MDILIVEDKASLRKALVEALRGEGYGVEEAADGAAALERLKARRYRLVLTDLRLPKKGGLEVLEAARDIDPPSAVVVMTAYGTVSDAVRAVKGGAVDFLEKPVDIERLLAVVRRAMREQGLLYEHLLLKEEMAERYDLPWIVGESESLKEVAAALQKAAATDATVLLQGESGTGKELFAHAVHALSVRKDAPFVALNCAAIPDALLENELFGHEKGAYTGAHEARIGKFELAHRGTLFMDEISELHPHLQGKVLRFIQEKTFERVGGLASIEVDVRLVAATNRNLEEETKAGRFREDLFYRLNVFPVTIPPLRERRGDILLLAGHFLERVARQAGKKGLSLSGAAEEVLLAYDWPGNVRELQNAVERAVILADRERIEPEHLMLESASSLGKKSWLVSAPLEGALKEAVERVKNAVEKEKITRALRAADGDAAQAAKALGIGAKTFAAKCRTHGIS